MTLQHVLGAWRQQRRATLIQLGREPLEPLAGLAVEGTSAARVAEPATRLLGASTEANDGSGPATRNQDPLGRKGSEGANAEERLRALGEVSMLRHRCRHQIDVEPALRHGVSVSHTSERAPVEIGKCG